MFDTSDIICGILLLGFITYVLIDSYLLGKKLEKRRKAFHEEINAKRIKDGREPIDFDASVGSSFSSSDERAADDFKSTMIKNSGFL